MLEFSMAQDKWESQLQGPVGALIPFVLKRRGGEYILRCNISHPSLQYTAVYLHVALYFCTSRKILESYKRSLSEKYK